MGRTSFGDPHGQRSGGAKTPCKKKKNSVELPETEGGKKVSRGGNPTNATGRPMTNEGQGNTGNDEVSGKRGQLPKWGRIKRKSVKRAGGYRRKRITQMGGGG